MITEKNLQLLTEADIYDIPSGMQGPGVAADKNAYNIYKKQVMNIYDAVRKAKGNK